MTPAAILWRRGLAAIAAVILAFTLLIAGQVPSASADDIGSELTNVELTLTGEDVATDGWGAEFTIVYGATVPDSAAAGDTWTLQLPKQMGAWPVNPIYGVHEGVDVVEVTFDPNTDVATFTLLPAGEDINNLAFTATFGGQLQFQDVKTQTVIELSVSANGQVIGELKQVTLNPQPKPALPGGSWKSMWFREANDQCRTNTDECIVSRITLKEGDHGMVKVVDTAGANFTHVCDSFRLEKLDFANPTPSGEPTVTIVTDEATFDCTGEQFTMWFDTTGTPDTTHYSLRYYGTARVPAGTGPVTYENSVTLFHDDVQVGAFSSAAHVNFQDILVSGAHVSIRKTDAAGNDANTSDLNAAEIADRAVLLPNGNTALTFTVLNSGTQDLVSITVKDAVTAGSGTVTGLTCDFPDGSTGLTWAGPLASTKSFTCTAELSGVVGAHTNVASVEAFGDADQNGEPDGDTPVTDSDADSDGDGDPPPRRRPRPNR